MPIALPCGHSTGGSRDWLCAQCGKCPECCKHETPELVHFASRPGAVAIHLAFVRRDRQA